MSEPTIASRRGPPRAASPARALAAGIARAMLMLALLTLVALGLRLNAPSAGFLLLVGVLLIGSRQPLAVATLAAVVATLSYNYYFFPPTRTLNVSDPENWIALATFLLTSLIANRLLVRERRQAEAARASREDLEALYEMSFALLRDASDVARIGEAAVGYLDRIGAASGGLVLFGSSPQHQQVAGWMGASLSDEVEDIAAGVGRHGIVTDIPSRFGRDLCVPLSVGGRVLGALLYRGPAGVPTGLESAANLLAFAIDRERFMQERVHVTALQEANELKTSLLQAVSHDLKSPLTVLSVESEALERIGPGSPAAAAHIGTIRDEVARLHRRIDNLLSVARFEAGIIAPHTEPTPAADLFRAARESLPTIAQTRVITTAVDEDTPDLLVDPSLALEIVINLLENAHRAAAPSTPIELCATASPEVEERVWVEVRDRGPGLSGDQATRVRKIDAPDAGTRGLGIELARRLAVLSGGSVEWFERTDGGTVARLDLPAAPAMIRGRT